VSVQLKGRAFGDIATDMVEGVLVVNGLEGEAARRFRTTFLDAVGADAPTPMRHPEAA
jgi:hypothetical protein